MNRLLSNLTTRAALGLFVSILFCSPGASADECKVINGTMCYWMENYTGNYCWVRSPSKVDKQGCFGLDSCDGGLGQSGGGCYKWADCSDCERDPWGKPSTVGNGSADDGGAIITDELEHNGYKFPSDLSATMANVTQSQLANHAWRLFIAANQGTGATKAGGGDRETPVTNFISTGSKPLYNADGNNPLIFEALYHRAEAFPYYSGNLPSSPINQAPVYRFQDDFTVSGQNYVNLDENNQIGQNMLFYRNSTGTGTTAHGIPGKNFPVLFMAKVNNMEVNYARGEIGSNGQKVSSPPAAGRSAPTGLSSWKFPDTTLEIKSAWRRIEDITQSSPAKYHQAKATYYVQKSGETEPTPVTDTFALIGLHIIQKTKNYPTFIFSTFEHVDAVVRDKAGSITDPAFKLSYTSLVYDTQNLQANAVGAYYQNEYGLPAAQNAQGSYQLPAAGKAPSQAQIDAGLVKDGFVTVTQPKTITAEINEVNNALHDLIVKQDPNSVWANYRLKGVQAIPTSNSAELDYYLANIVVESSQPGVQLFRGGVINPDKNGLFTSTRDGIVLQPGTLKDPKSGGLAGNISPHVVENQEVPAPTYNMGGCMGCHGVAQQNGQDFSFVASGAAGIGQELDTVHAVDATPAEIDALIQNAMQQGARRYHK